MYQLPVNRTAVVGNDTTIEMLTVYPVPDTTFTIGAPFFLLLIGSIYFTAKRNFLAGLISTSLWLNYNLCLWPYLIITKNCDDLEVCYTRFTIANFIIANICILFLIASIIGRAKLPEKYLTIRFRYINCLIYSLILTFLGTSSYIMTLISMLLEKSQTKYVQMSLYTTVTLAGTISFTFLAYFHRLTPEPIRDYFRSELFAI
ncbi:hypothetical protein TYRP_012163 [Tyrophagus putrescentiae]|nr:hypothetical protein TYRP_012163 [Tyrophagus putrescentiae]